MYELLRKIILNVRGNIEFVELKEPRCKVYLPDYTIWLLLREIYLIEVYGNFQGLDGTIIDAGAHCGAFSIPASYYANEVISIEPNPMNLKILEFNKIVNSRKNVKIFPYALYHKKGQFKLKLNGSLTSSINDKEGIDIFTITLDEILENYKRISLLKMDIEGAEFDVLLNTKPENLKKINKIVGELHYEDIRLRDKLKDYLESVGFYFQEIEKSTIYNLNLKSILKVLKNSRKVKNQLYNKITNYLYLFLLVRKPLISLTKKVRGN
ncbi:MAG: FkbM family methyltransferase [candidate division WOR-3 bacterium]